jgi:GDPmannose 4,6-dehydratase
MTMASAAPDRVDATGDAHSISDFVDTGFAVADMVADATKAWDPLGGKPTNSFHEMVVAMVDSDLSQERDA